MSELEQQTDPELELELEQEQELELKLDQCVIVPGSLRLLPISSLGPGTTLLPTALSTPHGGLQVTATLSHGCQLLPQGGVPSPRDHWQVLVFLRKGKMKEKNREKTLRLKS